MAREHEKSGDPATTAELVDLQPEVQDLSESEADNVRGGLVFNFKLVAVKTVSWESGDEAPAPTNP
jgi:hypothetical protein